MDNSETGRRSEGPRRPSRTGHARSGWRIAGRIAGVAACLGAMAAGAVFGHFYWGSPTLGRMMNKALGSVLTMRSPLESWTPEKQFPGRSAVNVLVLGVDYDYDNRAQIIRTSRGRSDSILLARIDFIARTINALTIPRDSAVRIPGHRGIHKINAAHAFGGPELTVETIREVFGVPVDACVVVNFDGFKKLVDAIGGVHINVQKRLKYDDNWGRLHVDLHPGYQLLNGEQAMGYVRIRKLDSDEMRSKRQHEFLEAVRTKLMAPSTFLRLPAVVERLNDMLKRNWITQDQMFALVNFARGLPKENIVVQTLPSYEGPSFVTIDTEKSAEVIQKMFFPYEQVALQIEAPDPNSVRSLNSRYSRGEGRRSRRSRSSTRSETHEQGPRPAPADLSVEEQPEPAPAPESAEPPAPETAPAPGDGASATPSSGPSA